MLLTIAMIVIIAPIEWAFLEWLYAQQNGSSSGWR